MKKRIYQQLFPFGFRTDLLLVYTSPHNDSTQTTAREKRNYYFISQHNVHGERVTREI
jgi:hypothetical protein